MNVMEQTVIVTGINKPVGQAAAAAINTEQTDIIGISYEDTPRPNSQASTYTAQSFVEGNITEQADAVFHLGDTINDLPPRKLSVPEGQRVIDAAADVTDKIVLGSSVRTASSHLLPDNETSAASKTLDPDAEYEMRRQQPSKLVDPRRNKPAGKAGEKLIEMEKNLRSLVNTGTIETGISLRLGYVTENKTQNTEEQARKRAAYISRKDFKHKISRMQESDASGYYQLFGVSDTPQRLYNIETPFLG
jgi:nucleoside-diphosphate-sugar epimerase